MPIDARIPLGVTPLDPNGFTNALAAGMKMRELQNAGDRAAYKDEAAVRKSNALAEFGQSDRGPEAVKRLYRDAPDAAPAAEKNIRDAGLADEQTKKYKADNAKADIMLMREASGALLANPTDENFEAIMASVAPRLSDPAMPKLWHTQWYSAKTPEAREGYARAWSMSAEKAQGLVMDQAKLNAPPKAVRNSYTGQWENPPAPGGQAPATGVGPEPTAPPGQGQGSSNLTQTEDPTYRYFKNRYGLSDAGAFALSRNITQESGHRTDVKGDGGKAQGLAQWHPDRYAKLVTWAQGQGLDPTSKQAQMDYVIEEGKSYPGYESLKGNDPEAIRAFIKNFEGYGVEGARFSGLDERASRGGGETPPPVDRQSAPVNGPQAPPAVPQASVGGSYRTPAQRDQARDARQAGRDAVADKRYQAQQDATNRRLGIAQQRQAAADKKAQYANEIASGQRLTPADASKAQQKLIRLEDFKRQIALVRANWEGRKDDKGNVVEKGVQNTAGAGPGAGIYAPGWAYGAGQKFDNSVESMAASKTALLRVPGIGSQSNYDAMLDRTDLPSRNTHEETTEQQIKAYEDLANNWETGLRAALAGPPAPPAEPGSGAEAGASPARTEFDSMPMARDLPGKAILLHTGVKYRSNGREWVRE